MTAKCVNPPCSAPFRYLRGGKLFLVDSATDPADSATLGAMTSAAHFSEFFWLCERCCQNMRIVVEKSGEVILLAGSDRQPILRGKPPQPQTKVAEAACQASIA